MTNLNRSSILALLALGWASGAFASGPASPRVGLHVTPRDPDPLSHVADVVSGLSAAQYDVDATTGQDYDMYLIVTHADTSEGVGSLLCGIDYTPAAGGGGLRVLGWTSCAQLEVPTGGKLGAWPQPGSGNRLLWPTTEGCRHAPTVGFEAEGAVAVAGVFTVHAYGEDYFTLTANRVPGGPGQLVLSDCAGDPTFVAECASAFVRFTSTGTAPGGNPSVPGAALQWVEKSERTLDAKVNSGLGMAAGDYDADGDIDLFSAGWPCRLLRNDGLGNFTDVAPPALSEISGAESGIWGDVDNDGDLDLFVGCTLADHLYRNDSGVLVDVTTPLLADTGDAGGLAWWDGDNDGDLDLYLGLTNRANRVLRNDGGFKFVNLPEPGILADPHSTQCSAWGDYDNDGDLDLYLSNRSYSNWLFRNDGNWNFVDVSRWPIWSPDWSASAAWGDIDNDLDLDLFVTNDTPQFNNLYRNEGGGVFTEITPTLLKDTGRGKAGIFGDYDNDGDLDIYLANASNSGLPIPCRLYRNEGGGVFTNMAEGPLGDAGGGIGAVWADVDGDGALDLGVNRSYGLKAPRVSRNRVGTANHWLQLKLVGTVSNRDAIGARVTLSAGGGKQMREVTTGGGYLSQNPQVVAFGLGQATVADTVWIRWPSGLVQQLRQVSADRRIVVAEHAQTLGVGNPESRPGVLLHAGLPNPFRNSTALRFELDAPGPGRLEVYDVTGRRLRVLAGNEAQEAGWHETVWDGRDEEGRPVPAGVYFARLSGSGPPQVQKLIRLP